MDETAKNLAYAAVQTVISTSNERASLPKDREFKIINTPRRQRASTTVPSSTPSSESAMCHRDDPRSAREPQSTRRNQRASRIKRMRAPRRDFARRVPVSKRAKLMGTWTHSFRKPHQTPCPPHAWVGRSAPSLRTSHVRPRSNQPRTFLLASPNAPFSVIRICIASASGAASKCWFACCNLSCTNTYRLSRHAQSSGATV